VIGRGAQAGGVAVLATPDEARRLQLAVERAPEGIGHLDGGGRFVTVNRALTRLTGWDRANLLGRTWETVIRAADQAEVRLALTAADGDLTAARQVRAQRPDGTSFPALLTMVSIGELDTGPGPTEHYLFLHDLTERKKIEDQLIGAGRMAAVGTLSAGVAHEINNPLAYIVANLDFARRQLGVASARLVELSAAHGELGLGLGEVNEALAEAREGAERVRGIVRDLKLFARGDDDAVMPVSLRRVLDSSINMAWNEIRHRARLVKDYGEVPVVDGNESRLGQVFLNLLLNAAQAIAEGASDENEIRVITRTDADGRAVVEVRDTGAGIPPEIQARIFEPFFTTKPPGIGTGLGLWICRGIVNAMGGEIVGLGEGGRGALFRVTLPTKSWAAAVGAAEPHAAEAPATSARVIVDDEPMILNALRRALGADHQVTTVAGGQAALALLGDGERFDVILCDLMMPEMSGMDLYDQIRRRAPGQADRIVFITGGAFTPRAREFLERVSNPRMEKPIEFQSLRTLIRNVTR
jgi:PAS domain S-box-containing protein